MQTKLLYQSKVYYQKVLKEKQETEETEEKSFCPFSHMHSTKKVNGRRTLVLMVLDAEDKYDGFLLFSPRY